MSIKNWPVNERPREKLLKFSASHLSDAELLAILLRTGTPGKTALQLAREAIGHFDSLHGLLNASVEQICQLKGVGVSTYVHLQSVLEIGRRYLEHELGQKTVLNHPSMVKQYLVTRIGNLTHEVFVGLFLNVHCKLIAFEELSRGTIDFAHIYPREIIKQTLFHNAAHVIIAHNHPSGACEPSQADLEITELLVRALSFVEVKLLDHLIVANNRAFSFLEAGLMT